MINQSEFRNKFRPKLRDEELKQDSSESQLRNQAKGWYRDFAIKKAKEKFLQNDKTAFSFDDLQFFFKGVNLLQGFVPGMVYSFTYKVTEKDSKTKQPFLISDLGPVWFHVSTNVQEKTINGVNLLNIPNPKDKIDFLDFIFQKYEKILFENYNKGLVTPDIRKQKALPILETMVRSYPKYQIPIKSLRLEGVSALPKIYSIADWVFVSYSPANLTTLPLQ